MDLIDITQEREQTALDAKIAEIRREAAKPVEELEECLNGCGEPPMPGATCCSEACMRDLSYRREIRRKQGAR